MYNNLIKTAGKWGGSGLLFGIGFAIFMFIGNFPLSAYAYVLNSAPINQGTEKLDFNSINNINNVTAPLNNLINGAVNSLKHNLTTDIVTSPSPIKSPSAQNTDFSKFFSSSTVSSGDIMGFLKEAAVTGINLTILVISITTQILKVLLSVFK